MRSNYSREERQKIVGVQRKYLLGCCEGPKSVISALARKSDGRPQSGLGTGGKCLHLYINNQNITMKKIGYLE